MTGCCMPTNIDDMWYIRNNIEHAHNALVDAEHINYAISDELHKGENNCKQLEQMFAEI